MKPPAYSPPYDSPIEDAFARELIRHLDQSIDLRTQHCVETICGLFIVDFVAIASDGTVIGFECDGAEFHDEYSDEWRDAMILGAKALTRIYRLRGVDINFYLRDLLHVIAVAEPNLFNDAARGRIKAGAYSLAREFSAEHIFSSKIFCTANSSDDSKDTHRIEIERRSQKIEWSKREFWQTYFSFACDCGGGKLDEVIKLWRNQSSCRTG